MSKQTKMIKPLAVALGATFAASLAASTVAHAAPAAGDNPFAMNDLGSGYMQVAGKDGKCGEGMKDKKDGKCGEGKKDMKDGKCGEGKDKKDGKCGEGNDKKDKKDGKCGEGKCGGK